MVFRAWAKEMFVNRDVMFNEHEVKPAVTTEPEITTRKQQQTLVQIV